MCCDSQFFSCRWCFPGGHCRESVWKLVRGQTALGGSHYVGPRTIQQCLDRCSNTTSCVAVDIDVDVVPLRCWMHYTRADLDALYAQDGTYHYQLVTRCPYARTGNSIYYITINRSVQIVTRCDYFLYSSVIASRAWYIAFVNHTVDVKKLQSRKARRPLVFSECRW